MNQASAFTLKIEFSNNNKKKYARNSLWTCVHFDSYQALSWHLSMTGTALLSIESHLVGCHLFKIDS